jgi:hypothetical protein
MMATLWTGGDGDRFRLEPETLNRAADQLHAHAKTSKLR